MCVWRGTTNPAPQTEVGFFGMELQINVSYRWAQQEEHSGVSSEFLDLDLGVKALPNQTIVSRGDTPSPLGCSLIPWIVWTTQSSSYIIIIDSEIITLVVRYSARSIHNELRATPKCITHVPHCVSCVWRAIASACARRLKKPLAVRWVGRVRWMRNIWLPVMPNEPKHMANRSGVATQGRVITVTTNSICYQGNTAWLAKNRHMYPYGSASTLLGCEVKGHW